MTPAAHAIKVELLAPAPRLVRAVGDVAVMRRALANLAIHVGGTVTVLCDPADPFTAAPYFKLRGQFRVEHSLPAAGRAPGAF